MARMRVAIAEGRLEDFRAGFAGQHLSGD
jgi:queuine/archaeosine tRNA-ribosyltransferase